MKAFLFILCAFYCYSAQAIRVTLQIAGADSQTTKFNYIKNYVFEYDMEDVLLHILVQQSQKLKQLVGKNPTQKDMLRLIEKVKANKESLKGVRETLAWLYFEKQYMKNILKTPKVSYFKEIIWDFQIESQIYNLFWLQGKRSYEARFIDSLKSYYSIINTTDSLKFKELIQNFYNHLRRYKPIEQTQLQETASFDFFWSFSVINSAHYSKSPSFLKEEEPLAKKILAKLNSENYIPAIYLTALIQLNNSQFKEAFESLQRIYKLDTHPQIPNVLISSALLLEYHFQNKKQAQFFFREAIDKSGAPQAYNLRPALLDSYLSTKNYSSALKVAQDMIQENTKYPSYIIMELSLFISSILYEGRRGVKQDLFGSMVWLKISQAMAKDYEEQTKVKIQEMEEVIEKDKKQMLRFEEGIRLELESWNDYLQVQIEVIKNGNALNLNYDEILQEVAIQKERVLQELESLKNEIQDREAYKQEREENLNFIHNHKLEIHYEENIRSQNPLLTAQQLQRAQTQGLKQYEFLFSVASCQSSFH